MAQMRVRSLRLPSESQHPGTVSRSAILPLSFYDRSCVTEIAKDLLGKILVTHTGGIRTAGRITETEAYAGHNDLACHAANGRRTRRNEVMFGPPGHAYVYLCYGIHSLFNVVTNGEGHADAVLIRSIHPLVGVETMLLRRGLTKAPKEFTTGPGRLTRALGIHTSHNGSSLLRGPSNAKHLTGDDSFEIWIESDGYRVNVESILVTPRIGVDYAGEDAKKPWRFVLK